jgi:sulfide:quinone oxidoreductase
VAHFSVEIFVENFLEHVEGRPMSHSFDGHANCFIESGDGKAMLIDFNYDTEPVTGHFPTPVGVPLLKESHLNHLGKLMFQWFYWHALLPGRDIPGISTDMPTAGKHLHAVGE